jgi:hypothetical protein
LTRSNGAFESFPPAPQRFERGVGTIPKFRTGRSNLFPTSQCFERGVRNNFSVSNGALEASFPSHRFERGVRNNGHVSNGASKLSIRSHCFERGVRNNAIVSNGAFETFFPLPVLRTEASRSRPPRTKTVVEGPQHDARWAQTSSKKPAKGIQIVQKRLLLHIPQRSEKEVSRIRPREPKT